MCSSGVRCGGDQSVCCDSGDVCVNGECEVPGAACQDSYDCDPGNFCEPTIGQCLSQPTGLTCEYTPVFDTLSVVEEWSFTSDEIISIPVVANLDGQGAPEVVVNLTRQPPTPTDWQVGAIAILDGATGQVVLPAVPHDPPTSYGSHGRSTIAVGDVSGDGAPDIVYAARAVSGRSLIVAIDRTGALLWRSHGAGGADYGLRIENGGATLANFDGDPEAEVVFGGTLIDNDGLVVWDGGVNGAGGQLGSNNGYMGGISSVADLDGDGHPEIVSGRNAWKVAWTAGVDGAPPTVVVMPYWTYAGDDGYPAVADLDGDGDPEVVLVANGRVLVLDGQTGELWCGIDPSGVACNADPTQRTQPIVIPGQVASNRGGPPTIGDFDGDGRPEIGVAGGHSYSVYDLARDGEDDPARRPRAGRGRHLRPLVAGDPRPVVQCDRLVGVRLPGRRRGRGRLRRRVLHAGLRRAPTAPPSSRSRTPPAPSTSTRSWSTSTRTATRRSWSSPTTLPRPAWSSAPTPAPARAVRLRRPQRPVGPAPAGCGTSTRTT